MSFHVNPGCTSTVWFKLTTDDSGRRQATDVTGPGGANVKGQPRQPMGMMGGPPFKVDETTYLKEFHKA